MAKADKSLLKALGACKQEIRMLKAEHKADLEQLRSQYRATIRRLTERLQMARRTKADKAKWKDTRKALAILATFGTLKPQRPGRRRPEFSRRRSN